MYDIDVGVVAGILLVTTVAAIEIGHRVGARVREKAAASTREHVSQTETATVGLVALLLAFTLSQSLQRFDTRSDQVVDEANAIGTAWLRIDLLPAALRDDARELMREYLDVRVRATRSSTDRVETVQQDNAEAGRLQTALWAFAGRVADMDGGYVRGGLFIQALNDMFDSYGRREADLARHVPEPVLLLLYSILFIAAGIVGFASGVNGHRPPVVTLIMVALIVALIAVILDLDRPRRGLVEVSKQSLYSLQASVGPPRGASAPPAPVGASPIAPAIAASR